MEEKKILLRLKPRFNIVYEMFLPTGKKIRNTSAILILLLVCYFFISIALGGGNTLRTMVMEKSNVDIVGMINDLSIFIIILIALKLIFHIVIQVWQYNSITYTFYEEYLEYEDSFLNQHRKTVVYDNIKEMEIRRTIWDRMNGYGMIVIYTNAEKASSNGLIIYSIRDPQKIYDTIDGIIYKRFGSPKVEQSKEEVVKSTGKVTEQPTIEKNQEKINEIIEEEKSFKESLNNKE